MDPNEVMKRIQRELQRFREAEAKEDLFEGSDLAEAVEALDQWLMKGGFLPERWKR